MKLRSLFFFVLVLLSAPAHAQVTPGSLSPIVIMARGQSNYVLAPSLSWQPNPIAKIWNNTVGSVSTGTAFVPLSNTSVSLPQKFASDVAAATGRPVCLIVSAFSGQSISHWMVGTGAPDAYADLIANIVPALTACKRDAVDIDLWWQGEANTGPPITSTYLADFETVMARLRSNAWYPRETPLIVHSIASAAISGNAQGDNFNNVLQAVVNADPDNRHFIYTPSFPSSFWDSGNPGHMTSAGYFHAGAMTARQYLRGISRGFAAPVIYQSATGNAVIGKPAYSAVPFVFNNNTGMVPPAASAMAQFVGVDGSNNYILVDAFGGFAGVIARAANGTMIAPTAITANQLIATYGVQIYDGAAFTANNVAAINFFKSGVDASVSDHGTYARLVLNKPGTINGFDSFAFNYGSAVVYGDGSGSGGGTYIAGVNGGVTAWSVGSYSAINGGAYDGTMTIESANGYRFFGLGAGIIMSSANGTLSVSGTLPAAQEPAHTGGCTNSAGSLALSCTSNSNFNFTAGQATGFAGGGATNFIGLSSLCAAGSEPFCYVPIATPTTLRNFYAVSPTAPGGSDTYTFMVRTGTSGSLSDSGVTCTITGAAKSCIDLTHSVVVTAGQVVTVRIIASATAAATTGITLGMTAVTTSP